MTYYDAEIEYLESDGNQFIDTGFYPNQDTGLKAELAFGTFNSWEVILGCREKVDTKEFTVQRTNGYRTLRALYGLKYTRNQLPNVATNRFSLNWNKRVITVNNTTYTFESQTFTCPYTLYLYGLHSSTSEYYKGKFWYCQIYDNDTLVRDFIPVRIGSVGYMYDKVSDTLFGNAGTGSFILGPDVAGWPGVVGKPKVSSIRRKMLQLMPKTDLKPFDYVLDGLVFHLDGIRNGTDATKWTDLIGGKYFTLNEHSIVHDDCIEMDGNGMILLNSAANNISAEAGTIEVCVDREAGSVVYIPNVSTYLSFMFGGGGFVIRPVQPNNQFTYGSDKTGKLTSSFNWNFGLVNGNKLTTKSNNNLNANISVAAIGGRNTGTAYYYTGKIYAIRMYNRQLTAGEMAHNQEVDNERFNLGLNILPYDSEVEYLESTGTQYIDTNTTYDSDADSLELEYEYTDRSISGDNMIMGVNFPTLTVNTYYNPVLYIGFNSFAGRVTLADTSKTYILIKDKKCYSKNANNVLVSIANWSSQDSFTTNNIYLFARNTDNVPKFLHKGIRIKRFKIENKIDLIPVRVGQVGYMYDRISNQLFANAGTGDFVLGPDVS